MVNYPLVKKYTHGTLFGDNLVAPWWENRRKEDRKCQ